MLHADTSPVVAKIGPVTITAAELERRLAAVPVFQLRTFGSTPAEIKKAFLDRVLVREALLSQGAVDRGLAERSDVKDRLRGVLRTEMLARLRSDVQRTSHVDDSDVKAYYEQNAAKFHSPARILLWMIALQKREEADAVLAELRKDVTPNPKHWTDLAREKSIDAATGFRGGNLGFVAPDGTTTEPGLRVSRAILDAVGKVKDAEIVPEPIHDGDRWVIVWRRQTMKSVDRSLESEAPSIKQMLLHMRTDAKVKETLAELRKQHLTEHNPELCDLFDVSPQGEMTVLRRPGALAAGKRAPATPVPTPGSLR